MAKIIGGAALAHSPLINADIDPNDRDLIAGYKAACRKAGEELKSSKPDVVLVFGQDHMRTLFYDLMPPIIIGTGKVHGWGDWDTRKGELPAKEDLARHIHRDLLSEGFDAACSYDLIVDHGVTQVLDLLGLPDDIPLIPVLINTIAPPLISLRRSFAIGQAVAQAVARFSGSLNVLVVGSGGISHSPPVGDVESKNPADAVKVHQLIHGRPDVEANEDARRERLIAGVRSGNYANSIDKNWDRMLLDVFINGEAEKIASENRDSEFLADGGTGGHEVRTWFAVSGALGGGSAQQICYFPIASLITGMGGIIYT